MSSELQAALARAEAAEAEVKRLEALELARANANARAERAERERATSDEVREMWFKKWCNADDERRNAERQRDAAIAASDARAEAMREACAKQAEGWMSEDSPHITSGNGNVWNVGSIYGEARDDAAAEIRALPIPAQEVK